MGRADAWTTKQNFFPLSIPVQKGSFAGQFWVHSIDCSSFPTLQKAPYISYWTYLNPCPLACSAELSRTSQCLGIMNGVLLGLLPSHTSASSPLPTQTLIQLDVLILLVKFSFHLYFGVHGGYNVTLLTVNVGHCFWGFASWLLFIENFREVHKQWNTVSMIFPESLTYLVFLFSQLHSLLYDKPKVN